MMKKRILSMILVMFMISTFLPCTAFTEDAVDYAPIDDAITESVTPIDASDEGDAGESETPGQSAENPEAENTVDVVPGDEPEPDTGSTPDTDDDATAMAEEDEESDVDLCAGETTSVHPLCTESGCSMDHNGSGHEDITFESISTFDDLKQYAQNGGSAYLTSNIELTETITVNATLNLCLNGYTITPLTDGNGNASFTDSAFKVTSAATFNLSLNDQH